MKNKSKSHRRQKAQRYGVWTEQLAAIALRLKGYRILARNFKTKEGEIDIIARKGDLVAIIEVKARKEISQSIDAVGYHNQQRIHAASDVWLSSRKDAHLLSFRYDIIAVQPWRWPTHFEDAF